MRNESIKKVNKDEREIKYRSWNVLIGRFSVYIIAIVLILIGTIISRNFLSYANLLNVIRAVALLGIVATGVYFVTYSGNFIDLSIPNIMAFAGIITILALRLGIVVGLFAGIIAGVIIGLINGLVIGYLKVNPIIWTVAISFILNGSMRWIYKGKQVYPDASSISSTTSNIFIKLSRIDFFNYIPLVVLVLVIMAILGNLLMAKTKFGAQLKLVGSSAEVAKMTGVNVKRITMIAFMLCAFAASIAGIFLTSLVKTGVYYNGEGYDFDALTAVVIGGVSLAGGKGNIIGVMGGVLVIGLMSNILTLLGVDTIVQLIVKGIIFIIVVGVNSHYLRRFEKDVI